MLGPVFRAELLTTSRRARNYAIRLLYGVVLLFVIGQSFLEWEYQHPSGVQMIGEMTLFTTQTFLNFAKVQSLLILMITPALVAGTIAEEKQRKTLHYILASELWSAEIVLGKLAARLLHVLVLLGVGLPIFSLLSLYGGVDPILVGVEYALTIAIIAFTGGVSILASTLAARPRGAIGMVYVLEILWLVVPLPLNHVINYVEWPVWFFWLTPLVQFLLWSNPIVFGNSPYTPYNLSSLSTNPWLVALVDAYRFHVLSLSAVLTVGGVISTFLAVRLLRPIHRLSENTPRQRRTKARRPDRQRVAVRRDAAARTRAACGDRPMIWKERISWRTRGPLRPLYRFLWLFFAVLLGCVIFDITRSTVNELMSSGAGSAPMVQARREFQQVMQNVSLLLLAVFLLGIGSSSAGSISGEREQDTWISLTATPLEGREILIAKIFGACYGMRWIALGMAVFWLFGLATGSLHWLGFLEALVLLGVAGGFTAALGTWISLGASTTVRSLSLTMGLLLGPTVLLYALGANPEAPRSMYAHLSLPMLMRGVLQGPAQLRGLNEIDPASALPLSMPALYLIAITVYGMLALGMTCRSIAVFDRVVGRPGSASAAKKV